MACSSPAASAATSDDAELAEYHATLSVSLLEPLTGKRRLPVPGRSKQQNEPALRLVEQAHQPRALDDVAARACDVRVHDSPHYLSGAAGPVPRRLTPNPPDFQRKERRARGAEAPRARLPLVPRTDGERLEALGERITPGAGAICGGDLAPPRHAELRPQRVAMSLGGPWGDMQRSCDLLVRAAGCDELHDLPLPIRDRRARVDQFHVHGGDASNASAPRPLAERRISSRLSRQYAWRPNENPSLPVAGRAGSTATRAAASPR